MELHEKIDQYLLDQLSPADKIKFEESIAGNSQLKSELALQQSVVTALGNTRSVQLKARLQKIPVSMASTGNVLRLKWLGAAAAGTVAAGLIIFLLTGQEQQSEQPESLSSQKTVENTEAVVANSAPVVVAIEKQTPAATEQIGAKKEKTFSSASAKSELKAFDNSASFEDNENSNLSTPDAENSSAPANTFYTENDNKLSNLSVNVDSSNPKDKSYQFTGPKLTLFGDFNSKPYELLELNNKGQKNLFLSYNNEYYELVWGQMKKTPLKKVSHKETLEKLKVINP